MSNTDGTCEYVLDPTDPKTWGGEEGNRCRLDDELLNEDGVWTCPHNVEENKNLCLFHLPVDEKNDDEVVDAFLDAVDETGSRGDAERRRLEFVSAKFGTFDLSENPVDLTVEDSRLSMDYVTVTGKLDWSEIALNGPRIIFRKAEFESEAVFREAEFGGEADFSGVEFEEVATFLSTEFGGEANFSNTEFGGVANFWRAGFEGNAYFTSTEFRGKTIFWDTEFRGEVGFRGLFGGETDFRGVEFGGKIDFKGVEFRRETNFSGAVFLEKTNFSKAEFGGKIEFEGVRFRGETDFSGAEFAGVAPVFTDVEFEEGPIFSDLTLDGIQFDGGDLTDATFTGASLRNANFESALLSRATLFDADLRGAKLSGAVLGDIRIGEGTRFLGHPSDDLDTSPHTVIAIRSRPTCI